MTDPRVELLALLTQRSFAQKRVTLASGRESDFFIDTKQTVLSAEGHALCGTLLLAAIAEFSPCAGVAGVELGGCPLASAVSTLSAIRGTPLDAVYVRKSNKEHGSRRLLEGSDRLPSGSALVILEDVVTTGGSTLAAVQKLRDHGFAVCAVIALVDRLEGGREAIERAGLPFRAIYTRKDFPLHEPTESGL